MNELITLITIGIALSMDAFSVSLGIGTLKIEEKKQLTIAMIVGIMHFIMPLLGIFIGDSLIKILHIEGHFLMAGILVLISFQMIRAFIKCEPKIFKVNFIEIILFALTVSFDSFSTGIGLSAFVESVLLASVIFAIISFCFTYLGLTIGKYTERRLGSYASLLGAILLIITAILSVFM